MTRRILLTAAYISWGLPLFAAVFCLAGYWLTRNLFFPSAGVIVLIAGFFISLGGFACAAAYLFLNRKEADLGRLKSRRRARTVWNPGRRVRNNP